MMQELYRVGDLIMYGATGVCKVVSIESHVFGPEDDKTYYILQPMYQSGTIYAPIDNNKIFIRPIMSEGEAIALIDQMPGVKSEVYKCNSIQQLSKHYQDVIDQHDLLSLVQLTKSIHKKKLEARRQNRHLGQIDKRFMKRAEDLLFGELAAALHLQREDVFGFIEDRISDMYIETKPN